MSRTARLLDAWGRGLFAHRGLCSAAVLLVSALLIGLAGYRVQRFGVPVDFTPQSLFIDEGEAVDDLRRVQSTFGRDDNDLLLLVEGPLASEAGAAYLRALHSRMAADPDVERVDSLVNAPLLRSEGPGQIEIIPALDLGSPAESVVAATADPSITPLLLSPEGDLTVVRARVRRELVEVADLGPAVDRLVAAARAEPVPSGFSLQPTGIPYVRTEVVGLMLKEELTFIPVVIVMFAVSICLLFRAVRLALVPLIGVLIADLWAVCALVSAGAQLTMLSILVPTLVLVVGVADGIHMCWRYREELAHDNQPQAALGRTLGGLGVACLLNSFTTAAGFGALMVARTRVLQDFGLHCGVAVLICGVAVMVVTPLLLAWLPTRWVGPPAAVSHGSAVQFFGWLDRFLAARPRQILVGGLAITGLAGLMAAQVEADSHILEMYQPGSPTYTAIRAADERLGGVIPIQIEVSGPPGSMDDPDTLRRMASLEEAVSAEAAVGWHGSWPGLVARLHGALSGSPGLPPSREALAQELLLTELGEPGALSELVNEDHSKARILATVTDVGGREILPMTARLEAAADARFAGSDLDVTVTGDGILAAVGIDRLIVDLRSSVGLVSIVIFGVMWLMLGSARLAAIAFLPNVLPLVFTQATLYLMGEPLQASNIICFTVSLGLAVDDTIHFIAHYSHERAAGRSIDEALRGTLQSTGAAMVITSALFILGLGVLAWSELTPTRSFGILASVTMVAALFGDLLLLPSLIRLLGDGHASKGAR
jgi:hypothetical protein